MAEYIEREALKEKAIYMHGFGQNKYVPLKAIENAPAADVEVVKHGRWVFDGQDHFCGRCNRNALCDKMTGEEVLSVVCPNCGAKMDLEG